MFSVMSVCQLFSPQGGGFHVTIKHDALYHTVQSPSTPCPLPQNMEPHCTGPPTDMRPHCTAPPAPNLSPISLDMEPHCTGIASDIWWPRLETCSNLFNSLSTSADIWWLLKQVPSAQASGTHPTGVLSCK